MTSATGPDQTGTSRSWTYGYDGMGNRTSVAVGGVSSVTTTDLQGWPTRTDAGTPTTPGDDTVYTYDPAGDLTGIDDLGGTAGDRGFGYDTWGLTTTATAGSTSLTYTLDPYGRTIGRQVGTGTVGAYAYVGLSEDLAADPTSTTVYGPAGPLVTKTGSSVAFALTDVHSDVVGTLATGAATMSKEYWYSPFGEQKVLAGSTTALGYQGDLTDPDTGTVDMGTRLYVPSLGRFSSRDVLFGETNDPMSMNQFTYAGASPITNWDPTGMKQLGGGGGVVCNRACTDDVFNPDDNYDSNNYWDTDYSSTSVAPSEAPVVVNFAYSPEQPFAWTHDEGPQDVRSEVPGGFLSLVAMYLAAVSLYGDPPPGSFTLSLDNRVEVITQDSAMFVVDTTITAKKELMQDFYSLSNVTYVLTTVRGAHIVSQGGWPEDQRESVSGSFEYARELGEPATAYVRVLASNNGGSISQTVPLVAEITTTFEPMHYPHFNGPCPPYPSGFLGPTLC